MVAEATSNANKPVIDEHGIFLPATWRREALTIPWDRLRDVRTNNGPFRVRILYVGEDGKPKSVGLGTWGYLVGLLMQQWRMAVVAQIAATGKLETDFPRPNPGRARAWIVGILGVTLVGAMVGGLVALFVFMASGLLRQSGETWSSMSRETKWLVYTLAFFPGSMAAIFPGVIIRDAYRGRRPRSWRYGWRNTRDGFFCKTESGTWEPVVLRVGDVIGPGRVVLDGRSIPSLLFGPSAILPHLLAIHALRRGVLPVPARPIYSLGVVVRLVLFWPLVIVGICCLPILLWGLPDMPLIRTTGAVWGVAGFYAFFVVFGLVHHFRETRAHRRALARFLEETEAMRKQLGW